MKTIEINEMGCYIDAAPTSMNLMFIGDTGIGKTTAIKTYCEERGIFLKTLILSTIEASESLGVPVRVDKEFNGKTYPVLTNAIPEWVFDLASHKNAILFLDEFLCAQPSVMNAFLNFLTEKRVGDIDLSHVKIVAATNVGMYTFEPDNNICSRFCCFYTINSSVNDYVNDPRIINNYRDENEKEGTIFEERSLKPRCHEQLSMVKDNDFLMDFYEGFTNTRYIMVHQDMEINSLISPFFEPCSQSLYSISEINATNMAALLRHKYPRVRSWSKTYNKFINVTTESLILIKDALGIE